MDILYRVLAYVGVVALIFGAGWSYRGRVDANAYQAKVTASLVEARRVETAWQGKFNDNARHLTDEINSITADRDALRVRYLAARRARMPEAARAECQGATGAELSGADAVFLDGEAARADVLREALISCYADLDSLTEKPRKD